MALENISSSSYFAGGGKYKGTKDGEVECKHGLRSGFGIRI
jgi:hypothetical protein